VASWWIIVSGSGRQAPTRSVPPVGGTVASWWIIVGGMASRLRQAPDRDDAPPERFEDPTVYNSLRGRTPWCWKLASCCDPVTVVEFPVFTSAPSRDHAWGPAAC
jgi:hypothetical protein